MSARNRLSHSVYTTVTRDATCSCEVSLHVKAPLNVRMKREAVRVNCFYQQHSNRESARLGLFQEGYAIFWNSFELFLISVSLMIMLAHQPQPGKSAHNPFPNARLSLPEEKRGLDSREWLKSSLTYY